MNASVPDVHTATLDEATLDELFGEVSSACTGLNVRVRRPSSATADAATVTLDVARAALRAGNAVQLRYEHDGVAWSDTLQPQPDGVRLIRCRLPEL